MASAIQPPSDWTDALPAVTLTVRHGSARPATYALDGVDFLLGSVPGCDLRVASDGPMLLCLIARHPSGVTLRKLTPTPALLVNGQSVSQRDLADGDRIQIGPVDIALAVGPLSSDLASPYELQAAAAQLRQKLLLFQTEKQALDARAHEIDCKIEQYEADVLRLHRLQSDVEIREVEVRKQANELNAKRDELQRNTAESEEQLAQLDQWRSKLAEQAESLARAKQTQDADARQMAERIAAFEGQQATLAVLRGRLERMRDEIRSRDQELERQREAMESRAAALAQKEEAFEKRRVDFESESTQTALDRETWRERSTAVELAAHQLRAAQEKLRLDADRIQRDAQELDQRKQRIEEGEAILHGRLTQLAETQERLDIDRKSLQERSVAIFEREQACVTLQEQLLRRSEELATRRKELEERLQEAQARSIQLDEREKQWTVEVEATRAELQRQAETIRIQVIEASGLEGKQLEQLQHLAARQQAQDEERALFQRDQQTAMERLFQARADLEALRDQALELVKQLPDAEVRADIAIGRLSGVREQLRGHLAEIHEYVRQCQVELEQLRSKLQSDVEGLKEHETSLRRNQDEHRLAVAAFRQQLVDWQAQIAELKRHLSRDESRLEKKHAEVEEQSRAMEAESQRLAQQAVEIEQQERDVADRRLEMDRHLGDMREWYRKKLRELAGIPLVPGAVVSEPPPAEAMEVGEDGEPGIVPIARNILSITAGADPGDQKLGQVMRSAQLIDADTLSALLAEARRQRRSLRQVLLASGVITLYQLALIEAGNVDGLMLGPVRIIDRLRNTARETVYRVFDPRRGAEAVLRHLGEADMADAVRPDAFRSRFTQAKLNDVHLANTLEVMDLAGRPAALEEWLTGLPSSDWPPLAAAPGVCHRLLTQAAQGLATAHRAGLVHGHLSEPLLFLTGDGILKICGLGEPAWLVGLQEDEDPTPRDDLRALGKIAAGWCTPAGVRKGPKTKPLPEPLISILYRLAADGDAGYREVAELLTDLHQAAASIPANSEAWDRLLKYVRENGAAEAVLRQSA